MNIQPYRTPPQWWSPNLNSFWTAFWRPFRQVRALNEHGLASVDVQGAEFLREAVAANYGTLITPNHPSHADPFALLGAADQLQLPLHFMTAWQVFAATHWLGRRVLRQHGCFSVNREGHDLRAYRRSVTLLEQRQPLVIFPEGEVFHLNDRVMQFRRGAATAAIRSAQRSQRPIACVPCGIRYRYTADPLPELTQALRRLEISVGIEPHGNRPLLERIRHLSVVALRAKEAEYFGKPSRGSLADRSGALVGSLLTRLESKYRSIAGTRTVPERVKELRRRSITVQETASQREDREAAQRDLDDLFFVMQLFSYPADYLDHNPSPERLAETVDKLEEDLLAVPRAGLRAPRHAVVRFSAPVMVTSRAAWTPKDLTAALEWRVQTVLDNMPRGCRRQPTAPLSTSDPPGWAAMPADA
jgi:1-acyl-sn-glycerol-3-phosphate acyltransferase